MSGERLLSLPRDDCSTHRKSVQVSRVPVTINVRVSAEPGAFSPANAYWTGSLRANQQHQQICGRDKAMCCSFCSLA